MILIIGGSGTLGTYFKDSLMGMGIAFEAPSSKVLDITSTVSIARYFANENPYKAIYLLAAETNVDLCETNPEFAFYKNELGTKLLAIMAEKLNIPLVYISTSSVFGGGVQKWRYCEIDTPAPTNLYGSSKLLGENEVKRHCSEYLIVRSSWMIGGGPVFDKKFLSKIIPQLRENRDLNIVHDKFGSLTYAKDLARFLVQAYQQSYRGLIHFSSANYASRYEIAKYVASLLGSSSKITGIDSCCFPLSAPRSVSEALYSVVGLVETRDWQSIITDYLMEWY